MNSLNQYYLYSLAVAGGHLHAYVRSQKEEHVETIPLAMLSVAEENGIPKAPIDFILATPLGGDDNKYREIIEKIIIEMGGNMDRDNKNEEFCWSCFFISTFHPNNRILLEIH